MGTKLGLEPQADSARAPPGHQAAFETLVTSMHRSSELCPVETLCLCAPDSL